MIDSRRVFGQELDTAAESLLCLPSLAPNDESQLKIPALVSQISLA